MSLDHMFNQLYVNSENNGSSESDDEPEHKLDRKPETFLRLSNSDFDGPFNRINPCTYENRKIIIPAISRRCLVRWSVGAQLATGTGAVVFNVDCDDVNMCQKVARISQLRTKQDMKKFTRDVQARYLLSCQCNIPITGLIDAFICTTRTKKFGVTISDRFDGTLVKHLLTLSSSNLRREFVKYTQQKLESIVSRMHSCRIVHRDLHHGNILLKYQAGETIIALTDFESGLGDYFGTSARVFTAYVYSDNSAIHAIVAELETICQYIDGDIDILDNHMLDALDITLEQLAPLRTHNGGRYEER